MSGFDLKPYVNPPLDNASKAWRLGVVRDAGGSIVNNVWLVRANQVLSGIDTNGALSRLAGDAKVYDLVYIVANLTQSSVEAALAVISHNVANSANVLKGFIYPPSNNGLIAEGDTIVITPTGLSAVTFSFTSGGDYQVTIGGTLANTLANLKTQIDAAVTAEDLPAGWTTVVQNSQYLEITTAASEVGGTISQAYAGAGLQLYLAVDVACTGKVRTVNPLQLNSINSD